MKITVTNTAKANRGFYDVSGQRVSVKPGDTKTAEVDDVTAEGIKANPDFDVSGTAKEAQKAEGEGDEIVKLVNGEEATMTALTQMEDAPFAEFYERVKGEKPHHAAKRETLIAKLKSE